ncbi:MAG: hypothetical protein MI919_15280 [Holophagales bacterium]|nr:hypothetical protein [Holophagales bacterium]
MSALTLLPATSSGEEPGATGGLDPRLISGLAARALGPYAMSGRVAALAVSPHDTDTLYVGAASGGVWKSSNAGTTWRPIFDDQPVASIGDVAISPVDPQVVWVASGEGNPRNSVLPGNGVYRSLDAGETWAHLGLEATESISRIVLHPGQRDTAWVAALGSPWIENAERGVFRTDDGGRSWRLQLHVDAATGAADLVADPSNPLHLLAAMWEYRRRPHVFESGGPGSGLYRSLDGGESWRRLGAENGLPEGPLGRMGLAFAPSDPRIAYAFVEHGGPFHSLLRSEDGGGTWAEVARSSDQPIGDRPFYFADLRVDPADPERVYSLWSFVSVSEDGGRSWRVLVPFAKAHPDFHAMWIDPEDPENLLLGSDGGVFHSMDRGETWRFVPNLPFAQVYRVSVDDAVPYRVYLGLQDNGVWYGPSEVFHGGGVRSHHWQELDVADGMGAWPHPGRPGVGYTASQNGSLSRFDLGTGEKMLLIRPESPPGEPRLRYGWRAPVALDPEDGDILYLGSQYLLRSPDGGRSWRRLGPDLTTDREDWQLWTESGGLTREGRGAEAYTTLSVIAPSPVDRRVIWTGSDDGLVHRSTDGGESWKRVSLPDGVPENPWVAHIEASLFDAAEAFLVLDEHRRGDWRPWVFRTRDGGRTWQPLVIPEATAGVHGAAQVLRQDSRARDLLFLGTLEGVWASLDGGRSWMRLRHGLPTSLPVMDLAIQHRQGALVIGSHGRGAFVIDDIEPLRQIAEEGLGGELRLFHPMPAHHLSDHLGPGPRFPGDDEARAPNPPRGARLYAWVNATTAASHAAARVEIRALDPEVGGTEPLRTFEVPVRAGLQRFLWDLRRDPFRLPPRPQIGLSQLGPRVPPGPYEVTVTLVARSGGTIGEPAAEPGAAVDMPSARAAAGSVAQEARGLGGEVEGREPEGATASVRLEVRSDPRLAAASSPIPRQGRLGRWRLQLRAGALQETVVDVLAGLAATSESLRGLTAVTHGEVGSAPPEPLPAELAERVARAADRVRDLERRIWAAPGRKGSYDFDTLFDAVGLASWLGGVTVREPWPVHLRYLERAEAQVVALLEDLRSFYGRDLQTLARELESETRHSLPVPAVPPNPSESSGTNPI